MTERNMLKEMPKRNPTSGTFELTVRCNLHCKMCLFRHDDSENEGIMSKELTTEQWIQLAKDVAEAGTINLLITGGEPMLRPDFCEIWEGIYKQGFILELFTNATLVTPKIMETLKKYPPHKIGVTLYGATPETYEKVCGNANALKQAIEGIQQLQNLPSIIKFRTTIIKDNCSDIDDIEQLVKTNFGENYKVTQTRMVNKSVRGACTDVESCRLNPKENLLTIHRRAIELIKNYVGDSYDEKYLALERVSINKEKCLDEKKCAEKLSLFGCEAGMNSYTISWDGKLLGCQILGCFSTDVLLLGFDKAWHEYPKIVKLPNLNKKCLSCKDLNSCICCYATRYAETGDLGGCPEYACKDTEYRNELLKRNKENCYEK